MKVKSGAVDEIIDLAGWAAIQAVLELSAQEGTAEALRQSGNKHAGEGVAVPACEARRLDERLGELLERRSEEKDLVIAYVDALCLASRGDPTVGMDRDGSKHVWDMEHGETENAAAVQDQLASLIERSLSPDRKRLIVVEGSNALRTGICKVFGSTPVHRRTHKLLNVLERFPEDQREQM